MNFFKFSTYKITSLHLTIIFFKLFGLAPFTVTILPKSLNRKKSIVCLSFSLTGNIYNFFLSLPSVFLLINLITNYHKISSKFVLEKWVAMSILWITPSIILYYCFKQREIIKIIEKLLELEYTLIDQFNQSVSQKQKNKYEIILCSTQIFLMIVYAILFIVQTKDFGILIIICSGFIINNLILQYTLLINYISKRLIFTNELLLSLTTFYEVDNNYRLIFVSNSSQDEMILKSFILIREIQRSLYDIMKKSLKFYSCPILFAVMLFSV